MTLAVLLIGRMPARVVEHSIETDRRADSPGLDDRSVPAALGGIGQRGNGQEEGRDDHGRVDSGWATGSRMREGRSAR